MIVTTLKARKLPALSLSGNICLKNTYVNSSILLKLRQLSLTKAKLMTLLASHFQVTIRTIKNSLQRLLKRFKHSNQPSSSTNQDENSFSVLCKIDF